MSELEKLFATPPSNKYLEGNVVSWDIQMGNTGHKATLGCIKAGTTAEFTIASSGEIFSCFHPLYQGNRIDISILRTAGLDEPVSMVLKRAGDTVHLPGDALVNFRVPEEGGPAFYICEYPGERPLTNGLVSGHHQLEIAHHLASGDFACSEEAKVGHRERNAIHKIDVCEYPIKNIFLETHDRALLEVRERTPDLVYFSGAQTLNVLSGSGNIFLFGLDGLDSWTEELSAGQTTEIPSGYMSSITADHKSTLVIRRTSQGFDPEDQFTIDQYRDVLPSDDRKLIDRVLRAVYGDVFGNVVPIRRTVVPGGTDVLGPHVAARRFGGPPSLETLI